MALVRRKRLEDGTFGELEKVNLDDLTDAEKIAILENSLIESQLALVEQFEVNLALQEEVTNTQIAIAEIYESVVNANG